MVRKWSYLENSNVNLTGGLLTEYSSLYNFKTFKYTTRFKKYNLGVTKIVRKTYSKRKHKTSWLTLSYITKSWVVFFLKLKQFVRFYQNLGLFKFQVYTPNLLVVFKKILSNPVSTGVNSFMCSYSILNHYKHPFNNLNILKIHNQTTLSNVTGVLVHSQESVQSLAKVHSNLVRYDNLLYPLDLDSPVNDLGTLFSNLNTNLFHNQLNFSIVMYRLLILCSLKNIKKKI